MKTKVLTNNNNFIFWSGLVNKIYNIYRFSYNKRKMSLLNMGNDQNCYDLRYLYIIRFSFLKDKSKIGRNNIVS